MSCKGRGGQGWIRKSEGGDKMAVWMTRDDAQEVSVMLLESMEDGCPRDCVYGCGRTEDGGEEGKRKDCVCGKACMDCSC